MKQIEEKFAQVVKLIAELQEEVREVEEFQFTGYDVDIEGELDDVRDDLEDAHTLFRRCRRKVEPKLKIVKKKA